MAGAESPPPLLVIVGPTASGKTALALELARRYQGEIISADSVQVYRYFDIGSGKPTASELDEIPHHLISAIEPTCAIDASTFAERARTLISDVYARRRVPIVCGGTFLWVKALVSGLAAAPPSDPMLRQTHQQIAETEGRAALHARLRNVDPESHQRLSPNDFVRVSRALEVYELTGKPLSALQAEHGFRPQHYTPEYLGVRHDTEQLTARIRERAERMLAAGWQDEVSDLVGRGYRATRPMKSVGYRQVLASVESEEPVAHATLVEDITRVTRIFSRRQRTWLRDEPVHWLTPEQADRVEIPEALLAPARLSISEA